MGKMGKISLIRGGSWELFQYHSTVSGLQSYIEHYCPTGASYYWYAIKGVDTPCPHCGESPDVSVLGAWKLHNMDYIQAGHSY